MDKGLKERWVAALRSGDYKQGAGYLCEDDAYCCLGVLCGIAEPTLNEAGVFVRETALGCMYLTEKDDAYHEFSLLRETAQDALGLSDLECTTLMEMNDGSRGVGGFAKVVARSFAEIADYIEATL